MTEPGRATVEIVADASGFATTLKRDADKQLRKVDLNVKPISDQIAAGLTDGVDRALDDLPDTAKQAFEEVARDADRVFDEVGDDAKDTADKVGREFQQSGERAEDAFEELRRKASAELAALQVRIADTKRSLHDMNEEWARTGDDAVRTKIRKETSLLRDLERAAQDLGGTSEEAFAKMAAAADREFAKAQKVADREFARIAAAARVAADRQAKEFRRAADKSEKSFRDMSRAADREFDQIVAKAKTAAAAISGGFGSVGKVGPLVKVLSTFAAIGSLIGPLTIGSIALGKAIAAVGKGLVTAAPLVAFLPSLAGAVGLIVGTLKLAGPALATAFAPVARQFVDADGNATAVTKTLQKLIAVGVEPLAKAFVKVNLPTIVAAMGQIAAATNRVITATGAWLNSVEGQQLIRIISEATAQAFDRLAPKITAAAVAMGRLAIRAGDKAIAGLGDLVGRVLDKFTAWADSTSIDDINRGLAMFKEGWAGLKTAFDHVVEVVDWVVDHQAQIKAFSTALGVFAVIGGAVSGNWPAAIIGGMSLLITNWDTVVRVFAGAKAWWKKIWTTLRDDPSVRDFVAAVKEHFDKLAPIIKEWWAEFQQKTLPKLKELWHTIRDELIPAVTDFIRAVSPFILWLFQEALPRVTGTFGLMIDVIRGALRTIAGIFEIFTAFITGDWKRLWHGLEDVVVGFRTVLWAVFGGALKTIWAEVQAFAAAVAGIWNSLWDGVGSAVVGAFTAALAAVRGFFADLGTWFANLPGQVGGALASMAGLLSDVLGRMFQAGLFAIGVGVGLILAAFLVLPRMVIDGLAALPGLLTEFFAFVWSTVLPAVWAGIWAVVNGFLSLPFMALAAVTGLAGMLWGFFTNVWTTGVAITSAGIDAVVAFFTNLPGRALGALASLGSIIGGAFTAALAWARSAVASGFDSIMALIGSVPGRISSFTGAMFNAGANLIRGFMSGLSQIGGFAGNVASAIVSGIRAGLNGVIGGINSGIAAIDAILPGSLPRIPSLATGGLTTREGLARLHPRELVLPLEDRRATDLLARALAEADAGLRAAGVLPPEAATPAFDIRVYIGDRELTDLVNTEISERDRTLKQRVKAKASIR